MTNSQQVNQGDSVTLTSSGTLLYVGSFLLLTTNGNTVSGAETSSGAGGDNLSNQTSSAATYSITCTSAGATISGVSPSTTSVGSNVVISGNGFWGTSKVLFGALPATVFTVNYGSGAPIINATVPNGSGTVAITVVTDAGTYTGGTFSFAPPTAGAVSATVAHGSSNNAITLNTSGNPTSVAVASAPAHGTAIASGTSITYSPVSSYSGSDSFTYTTSNNAGTSSPATVSITVGAPAITLSPTSLPNGTYGAAYTPVTFSASGESAPYTYAATGLPSGMIVNSVTGILSGMPTAAGVYSVAVSAIDSSTGTGAPFSKTNSMTLVIDKVPLTITVNSATKVYGSSLPTFNASYTGFVNGDSISNLTTAPVFSTTATSSSPVGTYPISASGAVDPNYSITYVASVLTVTAASTTTSITSVSPATPALGQAVMVNVTVSAQAPGSGTPTGAFTIVDGSVSCTATLANGAGSCSLTPPAPAGSQTITASYAATTDFAASTDTATLTVNAAPAGTSVISSANPSAFGQGVTFTATVTPSAGNPTPTGNVSFTDTTTNTSLCNTALVANSGNASAICTASALTVGAHTIQASYGGDTNSAASSAILTQTVSKDTTTLTLSASPNPAGPGQTVTLTATVYGDPPTGTVTFIDGTLQLGTGTLAPTSATSSVATFAISTLAPGTHNLSATYAGDGNNQASASVAIALAVNTPPVAAPMFDRWAMLLLGGLLGARVFWRLRRADQHL